MKDTALFTQLLGLQEPWKITSIEPDLDNKSISIHIVWPEGVKGPCPECEQPCPVYDHREEREWRHLDTMQFKTLLVAEVPRVNCPTHGIKSLKTPWADLKSRFTLLFERFAIDVLLSSNNQSKAAGLLGLSWDEVHAVQKRAVDRGLEKRILSETSHVGIDEKNFLKGQSYVSVLYDLDQSNVLEVVKDRDEESATKLLETIPEESRDKIEAVGVDMWQPFVNSIEKVLPSADIVHDKFHIVSHLCDAVDLVRRKEHKQLLIDDSDILKGTRYTWLRKPENWTEKDEATFEALKNAGLQVSRAWMIKENFAFFWDYVYEKSARKFFDQWYFWATHSRLEPIIKAAKMIKSHFENIITYLEHRITTAKAEGLNSKIQTVKSAARGFRNFENYRIAILFHCGGLNLYP